MEGPIRVIGWGFSFPTTRPGERVAAADLARETDPLDDPVAAGVGEPVPQPVEALTEPACDLVVEGELGGSPLADGAAFWADSRSSRPTYNSERTVPDALLQVPSEHVALGLPYDWLR